MIGFISVPVLSQGIPGFKILSFRDFSRRDYNPGLSKILIAEASSTFFQKSRDSIGVWVPLELALRGVTVCLR